MCVLSPCLIYWPQVPPVLKGGRHEDVNIRKQGTLGDLLSLSTPFLWEVTVSLAHYISCTLLSILFSSQFFNIFFLSFSMAIFTNRPSRLLILFSKTHLMHYYVQLYFFHLQFPFCSFKKKHGTSSSLVKFSIFVFSFLEHINHIYHFSSHPFIGSNYHLTILISGCEMVHTSIHIFITYRSQQHCEHIKCKHCNSSFISSFIMHIGRE